MIDQLINQFIETIACCVVYATLFFCCISISMLFAYVGINRSAMQSLALGCFWVFDGYGMGAYYLNYLIFS